VWRGGTGAAAAATAAAAAAAAAATILIQSSSYKAFTSAGNPVEADHGCDASWRGGALVGACRRWRRRRQQRRRRRVLRGLRGRGECTAAAVCASGVRARRPWKPAKTRGREQPPLSSSPISLLPSTVAPATTKTTISTTLAREGSSQVTTTTATATTLL